MSSNTGFFRTYSRDGGISPSIGDITDIFPVDMLDDLDVGGLGFDPYEIFDEITFGSVDRYFPADNEEEFLQPGPSTSKRVTKPRDKEETLPNGVVKPRYPYACLIYLALKNSPEGQLTVADIYSFITTNFPYFQYAQPGWKNSIRHNLSLNKSFSKNEQPSNGGTLRKTYLWTMSEKDGVEDKFENELDKFVVNTVKQWLFCADDYKGIRDGTKGLPIPEPKDTNGNSTDIFNNVKRVIRQEALEEQTRGEPRKSVSVRIAAEQTLEQLLNVKRKSNFDFYSRARLRKESPRSHEERKKVVPNPASVEGNVVPNSVISPRAPGPCVFGDGSRTTSPFIEPDVFKNEPHEAYSDSHGNYEKLGDFDRRQHQRKSHNVHYGYGATRYENVPKVVRCPSSVSSSYDACSDRHSDSSFSDRNGNNQDNASVMEDAIFQDDASTMEDVNAQENGYTLEDWQPQAHSNFTLNGLPFKRKFNFDNEGEQYLKKKRDDNPEDYNKCLQVSHPHTSRSYYSQQPFFPEMLDDKENYSYF